MAKSVAVLGALALAVLPAAAPAQTAYDLNRANQAMQICASPMGATIPECAQLRGMVGAPALPAASAGGLFGAAAQAFAGARAAPAVPAYGSPGYPAAPVDSQQYYVNSANATHNAALDYQACIQRVGPANPAGVQGCIAQLSAASGGSVAAPAASGFPGAVAANGFPSGAAAGVNPAIGQAAASILSALVGGR